MRMTEGMRRESERKRAERQQAVSNAAVDLQQANCAVVPVMNGPHVALVHLEFPEPGGARGRSIALDHLSDAEVDKALLSNSSFLFETCMAMHKAVRVLEPVIRDDAITGMQNKLKDLLGVGDAA